MCPPGATPSGNRVDRFNGGVAFVKDVASRTVCRASSKAVGTYTRVTVSALTFRNGVLATNWSMTA